MRVIHFIQTEMANYNGKTTTCMAYMYDTKIMHMQDILSAFLQLLAGPVFLIQKGQTFCGGAF